MSCSLKYEVIHVIIENSSKLKIKDMVFKMKGPSLLKMTSALKDTRSYNEDGEIKRDEEHDAKYGPGHVGHDGEEEEVLHTYDPNPREGVEEKEPYWPGGSPRSKEAKFQRQLRLLMDLGYTEEEARKKILEDE